MPILDTSTRSVACFAQSTLYMYVFYLEKDGWISKYKASLFLCPSIILDW